MTLPTGNGRRKPVEMNRLLVAVFIVFAAVKFVTWIPEYRAGHGIQIWLYTDWLIDYSHGFVRRGLAGEVIRRLSGFVTPEVTIVLLMWGIFTGVAIAYLRAVWNQLDRLNPIVVAPLLFLPSLLPFYLYNYAALGRKETVGFLILAWHLSLLEGRGNDRASSYIRHVAPVTMVALPIHLLMHEASVPLFVPVHLMISEAILRLDSSMRLGRRIVSLVTLYIPGLLAGFAVFLFGRPTPGTANAIYKNWEAVGAFYPGLSETATDNPAGALPGAFDSLSWTFPHAVSVATASSVPKVLSWITTLLIFGFCTAYAGSMVTDALTKATYRAGPDLRVFILAGPRKLLFKYFILPFLFSLPVYIVGWDLGRWFAVTCINYLFVTLSAAVTRAEVGYAERPNQTLDRVSGADGTRRFSFRFDRNGLVLLLIVFFLRLPYTNIHRFRMFAEPLKSWLKTF